MREFLRGAGLLLRGFGHWRHRPGLMAFGLIPAFIVGLVLLAGLVTLVISLPGITQSFTASTSAWPEFWAGALRVAIGAALLGVAIVLGVVLFTTVTLMVGEPFYARIWRSVEAEHGDREFEVEYGFWRAGVDALWLFLRGILVAVLAVLIGLVPVVGGLLSTVFAVAFTGWLLADELTSRAFTARGLGGAERRALRRRHRARVLGFGVATQLCFLVPFGAVASMPAAVAGSTLLARSLLAEGRIGHPGR